MSVHWETATARVRIANEGEEFPDGQRVDNGKSALIIDGGSGAVTIIEGTPGELADFAHRVTATVDPPVVRTRSTRARDRVSQLTLKGLMATARDPDTPRDPRSEASAN